MTGPVAETTYGKVQGAFVEGAAIFLGVPYGGSTSGENRFRPPTAPEAWEGIRDATVHGPWPPQPAPLVPHLGDVMPKLGVWLSHGSELPPTSEDCLNLNVFTPLARDGEDRPVMVWFHGGGCTAGSGNEASYEGSALAKRCDVVVVTVNARLGVLGYLYLGGFGIPGYEASGSVGALDHIAALRWVQDNIRSFGGNPGNVTIFGESGGGMKISVLLAMSEAHGLFHRAIIQSGVAESIRVHTPESATD